MSFYSKISLFAFLAAGTALGMEQPPLLRQGFEGQARLKAPAQNAAEVTLNQPIIEAHLKSDKIPSLKALVAKKIVNNFDLNWNALTVAKRKELREKISRLPNDIQNRILKTILKEKPRQLEQILNAQPVELTSWDANYCTVSPDSKFFYICARRKQSRNEPHYLIKVNALTLAQEELLNIEDKGITFNPQCTDIAVTEFKNNNTQFCVSLYNLATKQSRILFEGNSQPVLPHQYLPTPTLNFSLDNSYIIINHQNKSYCVNLENSQLCCPALNSFAIPLDSHRVLASDVNHTIKVIRRSDGKTDFIANHHTAQHCFCMPAACLLNQILYTISGNLLNLYNLHDGKLLKQIAFELPISGIDTTSKKVRIALMKEEFSHDVAEVDNDTGTYKICAKNQSMPTSMAACHASLSSDSLFHVNMCMRSRGISLQNSKGETIHQRSLQEMRPLDHRLLYVHLSPDNSLIYADTALDGMGGTNRMTYTKLLTHRALTNNTPLKDILALLILEDQKRKEDQRDNQLLSELLESTNPLIRELADTRYINHWKENIIRYLSYFNPG